MENRKIVVNIRNVVTRLPELRFEEPLNWIIEEGQQWGVIGPNGAGKTLIADVMQRKFALKEGEVAFGYEGNVGTLVKSIAFKDIYSLADCRNSYYQQRWHSTETDEVPTIEDILKEDAGSEDYHKVLSLFGIEELLPKKLIFLSSGELRKFLIVRTLLKHPRVLILDNPFIGLDAPSRGVLVEMLQQITKLKCVQVVLLLSNPDDIPEMITHVLPVKQRKCLPVYSREEFLKQTDLEKWALFGPNGAGKSTLLSLIYADNPQSYANTLYLFDRKRGSGESIWDIKKRIGYVSPEMHLFYMENVPVLNIVSSGFFDSIGLFRKCTERQQQVALAWMRVFGIEELKDRSFLTLSSGEQRLALLARAFVKDPDLIILDEPLHGLDVSNKKKVAAIIEQFCSRPGKTLIYVTHYLHELPACVDKRFELVKHA